MQKLMEKPYRNPADLQLALIRIYIGLNFTHHFAEKFGLLGAKTYEEVVQYFTAIGFSSIMVVISGLCAFAAFIGFTFGLFTRFAAIGTSLYLLIALFSGRHYLAGFSWANHTSGIVINGVEQTVYGGWEYPLFWSFICLSFVLTGGRKWSLDAHLRKSSSAIIRFLSQ
ncbi:DoxX family protein [Microbulbifer sp. TRSA005]|uniref:DoxX family protein n=1 Tax=Microbulbifer sp. TRSA005 TaxID=3243383 RepID=UPI004039F035